MNEAVERHQRVTLPKTVRIREIRDETRSVRTFVLDAEVPDAEPGQFVMLWLPGVDEKPMSITDPAPLTLAVARVGPFTMALHERKVGDAVGWRGPYGRGFSLHPDRRALLVGGGCGVGPIYFLAARAVALGVPTTVALGARTGDDLLYVDQFRTLGVDPYLATDDGTTGYRGNVAELAAELTDQPTSRSPHPPAIYACGPEPMLVALHRLCREHSIAGQLSLERYMKCGFGICGQCALDGYLVCQDGPVFDAEELDGLRDFGHARRSAAGRRLPIR
jgi:dihydroorotate dehydrogenase electron transfer subunit